VTGATLPGVGEGSSKRQGKNLRGGRTIGEVTGGRPRHGHTGIQKEWFRGGNIVTSQGGKAGLSPRSSTSAFFTIPGDTHGGREKGKKVGRGKKRWKGKGRGGDRRTGDTRGYKRGTGNRRWRADGRGTNMLKKPTWGGQQGPRVFNGKVWADRHRRGGGNGGGRAGKTPRGGGTFNQSPDRGPMTFPGRVTVCTIDLRKTGGYAFQASGHGGTKGGGQPNGAPVGNDGAQAGGPGLS